MKNRDKLNAMSNEEIAEILVTYEWDENLQEDIFYVNYPKFNKNGKRSKIGWKYKEYETREKAITACIKWLESEVK